MAQPEFDIRIGRDGRVKVIVQGVSGEECLELTDMLRDIIGREESRELTSEYYGPAGQVRVDDDLAVIGVPEAHNGVDTLARFAPVPAAPVIADPFAGAHLALTEFGQFFPGAVTPVRLVLGQPLVDYCAIPIVTIGLEVWALIPLHSQPFKGF